MRAIIKPHTHSVLHVLNMLTNCYVSMFNMFVSGACHLLRGIIITQLGPRL